MPNNLSTSTTYKKLIKTISSTVSTGLITAQKALEYQRLKTYWEVGDNLYTFASSDNTLILGEILYQRISEDIRIQTGLDLSADTISRTVQFRKNYPLFPKNTPLTFTHYVALQRISAPALRLKVEKRAISKDMTVAEIKDAVAAINIKQQLPPKEAKQKLTVQRGEPFVYYAYPETDVSGTTSMRIDCGFKINIEIPPYNKHKPDHSRVVRVVKEEGRYDVRMHRAGRDKLYTYPANVVKVIDGDTIDVRIDVGFGIGLNERLRLRGIDTPEINTQEGKLAKNFLTNHFAQTKGIIIRSTKEGMYGRWLADIFTHPESQDPYEVAAKGQYLNQLLLDQGLAKKYL